MNKRIKRISVGILTTLTVVSPVIAVSCGKNTLEKIEDEKGYLLNKFNESINQDRTITLKIDESKFNGKIKNSKDLIRYMLVPEYFTKKQTFFNPIIKNKEVLPNLITYNTWTSSMSEILESFSKTEDVKGLISSTQNHLRKAANKLLAISNEIFSIKKVIVQNSKNNSQTFYIEKEMIKYAKESLLDTWEIFKLVTSKESEKLIDKLNTEDPIKFIHSYQKMLKKPIIKKVIKVIKERTVSLDEIETEIDELIHLQERKKVT